MRELARLLKAEGLTSFDHKDNRIRCFPHVINICCQHVTVKFSALNREDSDDEEAAKDPTIPRDPLAKGRKLIQVIRGSGQRRDEFAAVIRNGNTLNHFTSEDGQRSIQIDKFQLLLDVRTRWDSLYYMLRRLRILRQVGH